MFNCISKSGKTYWSTKVEKGILYKPFNESRNYEDCVNNIPDDILERMPDGFLDDNGDFPSGNCFIIPLSELGIKFFDEIKDIGNGKPIEFMKVDPILDDDKKLDEPSDDYMYFSSRNELYIYQFDM